MKLIDSISGKHKMTTFQSLLKWLKAQGIIAIMTSTKDERIEEYLQTDSLPDLSAEEVKEITNVTGGVQHRTFDFIPRMDVQLFCSLLVLLSCMRMSLVSSHYNLAGEERVRPRP